MTMTSRLRIASGLLVTLGLAGRVRAQAPPPPPPGHVNSPPLEWPATDLEPITQDQAAREGATTRDAENSPMSHDALRTTEAPRPLDRAHAPKQPPAPIVERPSGARPQRR